MPERKSVGNASRKNELYRYQVKNGKPPNNQSSSPTPNVPNTALTALASQDIALNPPFDARMRRVGSPLNLAANIKRGWIQNADGTQRVNFLFNPAAIEVSSAVNAERTQNPLQKKDTQDVLSPDYTSTGSSTALSLLYDRTYELFSNPGVSTNPATYFGAYADILAWQRFTKMIDRAPVSWSEVLFTQPLNLVPAYLFVGPNLYFYGYVTSLSTAITHWTQNMVPQRAKVDIGFTILPTPGGSPGVVKADGSTSTAVENPSIALGQDIVDSLTSWFTPDPVSVPEYNNIGK